MLDADRVDAVVPPPSGGPPQPSRVDLLATPRRRALAACAVVALLLHGAFVGGIGGPSIGTTADPGAAPVSVRTIDTVAATVTPDAEPAVAETSFEPALAPLQSKPRVAKRPREPIGIVSPAASEPEIAEVIAGARIDGVSSAATVFDVAQPEPPLDATMAPPPPPANGAATGMAVASSPGRMAEAASSLLAEGEQPPPVYRTRLPPSATLRYQVRRGFLRGTGEIRWQPSEAGYKLVLEARIAGLTLLVQTSEGAIDANGLAPRRFLDQRARRPPQAANFRRDVDRITFSGPGVEWPLLPGTQDRLSWMIQLAGIAAAEPGLLVEGGRISMVVVGARGEASVWTMRCDGPEDVETAWGTVHAVKLVRQGHSLYDTNAEIWLDPARDFLPAHATLRNSAGASEYDLLLERVEPGS